MPKRPYTVGLSQRLQEDPNYVVEYLNAALADSNEVFLLALRDVAEAQSMGKVAENASLNRENLYRMLSREGNPRLSSLAALLDTFGLKLKVAPGLKEEPRNSSTTRISARKKIRHGGL